MLDDESVRWLYTAPNGYPLAFQVRFRRVHSARRRCAALANWVDICMEHIRIMVANEPRAYREAIGSALWELRPQTQVTIATPEELDGEVLRLHPHVVVCSELTDAVREHAMTWIVLYPNGKPLVVV